MSQCSRAKPGYFIDLIAAGKFDGREKNSFRLACNTAKAFGYQQLRSYAIYNCYIDLSNQIYISSMLTILDSGFIASCSNNSPATVLQPSQVGSLLPNTLNEEMSRDEIRKALINVQLTEYAMFPQSDSDNLAAKDRIKALIRSSQTPEKLHKASAVNLQKLSHSLQSGVNYGSSACTCI